MRYATIVLFISVLIGLSANVSGYSMMECDGTDFTVQWPTTAVTLRGSAISFPTSSAFRTVFNSTVNRWNDTASKFTYIMQYGDTSVAMDNGQSEVWWSNNFGAPAIAYIWWNGSCEITEADVLFDNTVAYTTGTVKTDLLAYGGTRRPFQTTAMHELGHVQGLDHVNTIYNIMGQDWTHIHVNGGTTAAYPGEDAVNGSIVMYGVELGPNSSLRQDLGVSHWRRTGSSGEYSTHGRTRIFDKSGVLLSKAAWPGTVEPFYLVNKGQSIKPEFTFENMGGTFSQTVIVQYYLSTNDLITTGDTFLGTRTVTINRNTPDTTFNATLALPNNLTSGTKYWIGVIVDPHNNVNEYNEQNNATYIGIKVK